MQCNKNSVMTELLNCYVQGFTICCCTTKLFGTNIIGNKCSRKYIKIIYF